MEETTRTGTGAAYPLAAIRLAIGLPALLAPGAVATMLRLEGDVAYPIRLWGARNLALAAGTADRDRSIRRATVTAGMAIDLLDAGAGLMSAGRAPRLLRFGLPALAAALGAMVRRRP